MESGPGSTAPNVRPGAGHYQPKRLTDIRQTWLEIAIENDENGKAVFETGELDKDFRLKDKRIPPLKSVTGMIQLPSVSSEESSTTRTISPAAIS